MKRQFLAVLVGAAVCFAAKSADGADQCGMARLEHRSALTAPTGTAASRQLGRHGGDRQLAAIP